jgi:hypothetical protein
MKYFYPFFVLLLSLTLSAGTYNKTENLVLPAQGIEKFDIECEAGFLKVTGVEGLESIEVMAEIEVRGIAEDELERFIERNITLFVEKRGNKGILKSKVDNYFSGDAHINLTVKVPKKMNLKIEDGSGSIEMSAINGDVEIDDGSGEIGVETITGNLEITDGSGDIDVRNVEGNLSVDDGSGGIDVRDIRGDVSVDDGSGGMDIEKVSGNVTVSDGSGSIYINDVEKNVNIRESGSGGLTVKNVKGEVNKRD